MTAVEVRPCPLGPASREARPVAYAWCAGCDHVRKSTRDCPMIAAQTATGHTPVMVRLIDLSTLITCICGWKGPATTNRNIATTHWAAHLETP